MYYLFPFNIGIDMIKPQWLPENSISGCKQLIQEYWIRENAVKNIDINIDNNHIGQDAHLDDSKTDQSKPSYNSRSIMSSSSQSHIGFCSQFETVTSIKKQKNYSQHSKDQVLQKVK